MGLESIWHWAILFFIVLLVFGPKRIPEISRALGKGIREFKDATRGITNELEQDELRSRREVAPPNPPLQVQAPPDTVNRTPGTDSSGAH